MTRRWMMGLVLAAACGPATGGPVAPMIEVDEKEEVVAPRPQPGHAAISGRVRDAGTGEVVVGATIVASRDGKPGRWAAVSDQAGWYELNDLDPASYQLTVYHGDSVGQLEVRAAAGWNAVLLAIELPPLERGASMGLIDGGGVVLEHDECFRGPGPTPAGSTRRSR